jgi:hypothetical protein
MVIHGESGGVAFFFCVPFTSYGPRHENQFGLRSHTFHPIACIPNVSQHLSQTPMLSFEKCEKQFPFLRGIL